MSALSIWQGLEAAFRNIEGLHAILLGEPTSIQATPLLYAGYAGANTVLRSQAPARNIDGTSHEFAVRLVFDWQDNPQAEMQLLTLADSVPAAINADPRLGGRLTGGIASATLAFSGMAVIAKKEYRVLDYTVQVLEKSEATA